MSMETGDRQEVSRRIGWKLSFLEEAGLKIGRKAWDARIHVPISIRTKIKKKNKQCYHCFFIDRLCRSLSIFRPGQDAKLIVFSLK